MKLVKTMLGLLVMLALLNGCKKDKQTAEPKLIFKFKFDPNQQRLDNFGQPTGMPSGHAGQNPSFHKMSAHYIELAPSALTQLGAGAVLYRAPETTVGGSNAIDFSQSVLAGDGETFFSVPLKDVAAGNYQYLRVSLAYQNFDVQLYLDTMGLQQEFPATIASFVGFNTYITNYNISTQNVTVNANKAQGYWGFESNISTPYGTYKYWTTGQAPANATTVVNPISSTSPIPAGSCVETGAFSGGNLQITGNETKDIVVTVSLSTNKSFEWVEVNADGKWEPAKGETIVDMGLRGLIPYVQY